MNGWTCARCGRVLDFQNEEEEPQKWHLGSAGVLCPDCVTADDLLADRFATFWLNRQTWTTHIACRCEADLGPVPDTAPADITCASCGATWAYLPATVGFTLKLKTPTPPD